MDDFIFDLLYIPKEKAPERYIVTEPAKNIENIIGDDQFLHYCLCMVVMGISGFFLRCMFSRRNGRAGDFSPHTSPVTTHTLISKDDSAEMTLYYPNKEPFPFEHTHTEMDDRVFGDRIRPLEPNLKKSNPYESRVYHTFDEMLKPIIPVGPTNDSTVASTIETAFNKHLTMDSTDMSPPRIERYKERQQLSDSSSDSETSDDDIKITEKTQKPATFKVELSSHQNRKSSVRIDEFGDVMCLHAKRCNSTVSSITKTSINRSHLTKSSHQHSPNRHNNIDNEENAKSSTGPKAESSHLYISAGKFTVEVTAKKSPQESTKSPFEVISISGKSQRDGKGLSLRTVSPLKHSSDTKLSCGSKSVKNMSKYPLYLEWKRSSQSKKKKKADSQLSMRTNQHDVSVGNSKSDRIKTKSVSSPKNIKTSQNNGATLPETSGNLTKTSKVCDQSAMTSKQSTRAHLNKSYLGSRPSVGFASQVSIKRKHKLGGKSFDNHEKIENPKPVDIRDPKYFSVEKRKVELKENEHEVSTYSKKYHLQGNPKQKRNQTIDKYSTRVTKLLENTKASVGKEMAGIEKRHRKQSSISTRSHKVDDIKHNPKSKSEAKIRYKHVNAGNTKKSETGENTEKTASVTNSIYTKKNRTKFHRKIAPKGKCIDLLAHHSPCTKERHDKSKNFEAIRRSMNIEKQRIDVKTLARVTAPRKPLEGSSHQREEPMGRFIIPNKTRPCITTVPNSEDFMVTPLLKQKAKYTPIGVVDLLSPMNSVEPDAQQILQGMQHITGVDHGGMSFSLYNKRPLAINGPQLDSKLPCNIQSTSSPHENNVSRIPGFKLNNECLLYIDSPLESHAKPVLFPFPEIKRSGYLSSTPQMSVPSSDGKQSDAQKMNDDLVEERIERLREAKYRHKRQQNLRHDFVSSESSLEVISHSQAEHMKRSIEKLEQRQINSRGGGNDNSDTNDEEDYFGSGEMLEELRRNGCFKSIQMLEESRRKPFFVNKQSVDEANDYIGSNYTLEDCKINSTYPEGNPEKITLEVKGDACVNHESERQQMIFPRHNNCLQSGIQNQKDSELSDHYSRSSKSLSRNGSNLAMPDEEYQDKEDSMLQDNGTNRPCPMLTLSAKLSNSRKLYEDIVRKKIKKMKRRCHRRSLNNSLKCDSHYLELSAGQRSLTRCNPEGWKPIIRPVNQISRLKNNIKPDRGEFRSLEKGGERVTLYGCRNSKTKSKNIKSDMKNLEGEKYTTGKHFNSIKDQQTRDFLFDDEQIKNSGSWSIPNDDLSNETHATVAKSPQNNESGHDIESYSNLNKETIDQYRKVSVPEKSKDVSRVRKREQETEDTSKGKQGKSPRKENVNLTMKNKVNAQNEIRPQLDQKLKGTRNLSESKPKLRNRLSKTKRLRYIFHKAPVKPKITKDETNPASASEHVSHLDPPSPYSSSKKDTRPINTSSYQILRKDSKDKPVVSASGKSPQIENVETKQSISKLNKPVGNTFRTAQETNNICIESKKDNCSKKESREIKETNRVGESSISTYKTLHKRRNQSIPVPPGAAEKQNRRMMLLNTKYNQLKATNKSSTMDESRQTSFMEEDKDVHEDSEDNQAKKGVKEGHSYRSMHSHLLNTKPQAEKNRPLQPTLPNERLIPGNGGVEATVSTPCEYGKKQSRYSATRQRLNNGRYNTTESSSWNKRTNKTPKGQSYLQVYRDSTRVWSPSLPTLTQSIEKLSGSNLSKQQVEESEEIGVWSTADVTSKEGSRQPYNELDIIDEVSTKSNRHEMFDFGTTQDSEYAVSNNVVDIDGMPVPTLNLYEPRAGGLNSILSNLACIEDLDPDEEEKLLLPQHLPDLILTSSGDLSCVANNFSGYSNSEYVLGSHMYGSNETCNHARSYQKDESKQSIRLSLSPTYLIPDRNNVNVLLGNTVYNERIASPENIIDKISTNANITETLEQGTRIVQRTMSSSRTKSKESTSHLLSNDSINENKLSESIRSNKRSICNVPEGAISPECVPSLDLNTDRNISLKQQPSPAKFTTPNFHDIFKDTETLQKWTKAIIPPKVTSLSNGEKSFDVARKCESARCFQQEDTERARPKFRTHEIATNYSLNKSVTTASSDHENETITSKDILEQRYTSGDTNEGHLRTSKDKESDAASEVRSCAVPDLEHNKTPQQLKPDTLILNGTRDRNLSGEAPKSEKSNLQSTSDIVISWLDDDGKDVTSKRKRKITASLNSKDSRDKESPAIALISSSGTVNATADAGKAESLTDKTKSNVPKLLESQGEQEQGDSPFLDMNSFKAERENIFLKMARIKRPRLNERLVVNSKEISTVITAHEQHGMLISPPKGSGFYVKSAMSYTKKKCLCSTNNSVCTHHDTSSLGHTGDETLIQDHLSGLESISNMREQAQQQLTSNTARDSTQTPKRMTKNNNKTRITLTSMYTTLIDAVGHDEETQSSSCNAYSFEEDDLVPHNVFAGESWDDTSNDVLTDELCSGCSSSWTDCASSEQNAIMTTTLPDNRTDATDCTSSQQSSSNGQAFHESKPCFLLDWYRPSLPAKTMFGTRTVSGAEEYDDDDCGGDDNDDDDDDDDDDDSGGRINDGGADDDDYDSDTDNDDDNDYNYNDDDGDKDDEVDSDAGDADDENGDEDDGDDTNDDDDDDDDDGHDDDRGGGYKAITDEYPDNTSSIIQDNNTYTCSSDDQSCPSSATGGYFTSYPSPDRSSCSFTDRRSLENTNSKHTDPSFRSTFTWCDRHRNLNHTLSNNNKFVVSTQTQIEGNNSESLPSHAIQLTLGGKYPSHLEGFTSSSNGSVCKTITKTSDGRFNSNSSYANENDKKAAFDKLDISLISGESESGSSVGGFSTRCHPSDSDKEVVCTDTVVPELNLMRFFEGSQLNISNFDLSRTRSSTSSSSSSGGSGNCSNYSSFQHQKKPKCGNLSEGTDVPRTVKESKCERVGFDFDENETLLSSCQNEKKQSICNSIEENTFCTCPSPNPKTIFNDGFHNNSTSPSPFSCLTLTQTEKSPLPKDDCYKGFAVSRSGMRESKTLKRIRSMPYGHPQ